MASKLVPCKLCKKEISSNASTCPHCGEKKPVIEKVGIIGKIIGVTIWVFIGFSVLAGIVGLFTDSNNKSTNTTPTSTLSKAQIEEQLYKDKCRDDWKACKDNHDIIEMNWQLPIDMEVKCKRAAEANSKFDINWGWSKFGSYNRGNSALTDGKILLLDDSAKYKNAFGGEIKTKTSCLFNLKTMEVDEISTE